MDLGLKGKKAIVCASSRGLGRGCARALAQAGVDVVVNGRNQELLQQFSDELSATYNVRAIPVAADVSTREGQRALLDACPEPDILINNNGGPPRKDFRQLNREDMIEGVTMNMIAPIELIQAVVDGMAERKFGRIVNITSVSVKMPLEGLDLSSGARAGLTGFIAGICRPYSKSNVTINNLLPGMFDTDRLRASFPVLAKMRGQTPEEIAAERAASCPAGRFGNPEEFGQTCAFLCSQHAGYITGQNILIDGGWFNGSF